MRRDEASRVAASTTSNLAQNQEVLPAKRVVVAVANEKSIFNRVGFSAQFALAHHNRQLTLELPTEAIIKGWSKTLVHLTPRQLGQHLHTQLMARGRSPFGWLLPLLLLLQECDLVWPSCWNGIRGETNRDLQHIYIGVLVMQIKNQVTEYPEMVFKLALISDMQQYQWQVQRLEADQLHKLYQEVGMEPQRPYDLESFPCPLILALHAEEDPGCPLVELLSKTAWTNFRSEAAQRHLGWLVDPEEDEDQGCLRSVVTQILLVLPRIKLATLLMNLFRQSGGILQPASYYKLIWDHFATMIPEPPPPHAVPTKSDLMDLGK